MDTKSLADYFVDWYGSALGFGYGTGDVYYCEALTKFFKNVDGEQGSYKFEDMEKKVGKDAFWFLISIFGNSDFIEYGTSPRYGWLTEKGKLARQFVNHIGEDLYDEVNRDSDYIECYKDYCNHTDNNEKGCKLNPFWNEKEVNRWLTSPLKES